jgi:hypothetical protein
VGAEHDAADRGDEQHDRRDLEREEVVGEEELADLLRRAERPAYVRGPGEEAARLQTDDDHDLREDGAAREHRADDLPRRPSRPRRVLAAVAEVGDHEQEHHHHRAAVDEHLPRGDELARQQEEQHGERRQVADQRERRVERVAERDDGERAREARECRDEPHNPDEEVSHAVSPCGRNG